MGSDWTPFHPVAAAGTVGGDVHLMGAVLVDPGLRHGPGMQGQGDGGLVLRTPVVQGAAPPGRVVPIVWPGGRARCCRAGLWGLEGESEVLFRGRLQVETVDEVSRAGATGLTGGGAGLRWKEGASSKGE